jgi:hypothetical protein
VTTKTRPKKEFKEPDAKHTQLVLWMEPDSTPRAPRTRILLMLAMHLFCASGGRIGALFPINLGAFTNSQQISKHNLGTYREILEWVGVAFEAVAYYPNNDQANVSPVTEPLKRTANSELDSCEILSKVRRSAR